MNRSVKVCLYSVTDESCILADHRMTIIRQQSDGLVLFFRRRCIAASPSTVYRRREDEPMKALKEK